MDEIKFKLKPVEKSIMFERARIAYQYLSCVCLNNIAHIVIKKYYGIKHR